MLKDRASMTRLEGWRAYLCEYGRKYHESVGRDIRRNLKYAELFATFYNATPWSEQEWALKVLDAKPLLIHYIDEYLVGHRGTLQAGNNLLVNYRNADGYDNEEGLVLAIITEEREKISHIETDLAVLKQGWNYVQ